MSLEPRVRAQPQRWLGAAWGSPLRTSCASLSPPVAGFKQHRRLPTAQAIHSVGAEDVLPCPNLQKAQDKQADARPSSGSWSIAGPGSSSASPAAASESRSLEGPERSGPRRAPRSLSYDLRQRRGHCQGPRPRGQTEAGRAGRGGAGGGALRGGARGWRPLPATAPSDGDGPGLRGSPHQASSAIAG